MTTGIRTPDQRVRVFISSTIQELAEERKAVREAIESLHLIPVFFEAGARPHPPRDLYRAYLEQSHIFLGIYWNRYGWIAPGMEISGLEDEYLLSNGKPRLIYIKHSDSEREPGMVKLLRKIEEGGAACYQKFSTPEELRELVTNDLSLFLSEQFHAQQDEQEEPVEDKRTPLPSARVVLIGREKEINAVIELLLKPEISLVTITGAGGTGKTQLSIHIANNLADKFSDGIFFIPLSTLHDKDAFIPFITKHIGFFDSGKQDLKQALIQYLSDKRCILIFDNFEQIVSAASEVADILSYCRHLKVLVTSRTPLHIAAENVFPLMPLAVTGELHKGNKEELTDIPAIKLFIQRAREINPSLSLDEGDLEAIHQICLKLNGIPLAIELAAARTRLLSPVALLNRMSKMLDTLVHGRQDSPDRHRTLRSTIDWSHNLLDEAGKAVFRRLAILSGQWNLEDVESIVNWEHYNILDILEKLMDVSLIQCQYKEGDNAFSMFEAVREYAFEQVEKCNETEALWKAHLDYHLRLMMETNPYAWSAQRVIWFKRLERESHHIRDAFDYAVQHSDYTSAWKVVYALGYYWSFYGKITEGFQMIELAKVSSDVAINGSFRVEIPEEVQAGALRTSGMLHFFASAFKPAVADLEESIRLYLKKGNEMEAARAMSYYGVAAISTGNLQAHSYFEKAIAISRQYDDKHNLVIASAFLSEIKMAMQEPETAKELVSGALMTARKHGDALLIALALGQSGNINVMLGKFDDAEQAYRESLAYGKEMPLGSMKGWFEIGLAYCLHIRHSKTEAMHFLYQGLQSGRQVGDLSIVLSGFLGFAVVALDEHQYARAAWLFGAAENLRRLSGYTLWNTSRKAHEEIRDKLNAYADQSLVELEKQKGTDASLDEAIVFALTTASP